jgi:lysophospholipid acyltransferase (LPLAT)-like uncharacterized protein
MEKSNEIAPPPDRAIPISAKSHRIGWAAATLIRLFSCTYRWRIEDPDNLSADPPGHPMIWAFWHNRIFVVPVMYRKFLKTRSGAVLSSASKDGEIIAATVSRFGCHSVRGSSSRRGTAALRGLIEWIQAGYDVAVVPDGPRGPRYKLGPGVVRLAQTTNAKILPIRVEYGSFWAFRSWDKFRLPKPFTCVTITFEPLIDVAENLDEEAFEFERQRIENALNPHNETD